jgi:hypothetical protein
MFLMCIIYSHITGYATSSIYYQLWGKILKNIH